MTITDVIKNRFYVRISTGTRYSIYGARPWQSDAEKADFREASDGYAVRLDDGTVHSPPASIDRRDALAVYRWANNVNENRREQLRAHGERYPEQASRCAAKAAAIPSFDGETPSNY